MKTSKLVKNQKRKFKKRVKYCGESADLVVTIRHDDECGNGHNTFSITGSIYKAGRRTDSVYSAGGRIHDEIAKAFPELAPLIKWHLCSTNGPMHYPGNALYHAGDRDCWGLQKGEKRQIKNGKTGLNVWQAVTINGKGEELPVRGYSWKNSETKPENDGSIVWVPVYRIGEGKDQDLNAARNCAIWPEAELSDFTKEKLEARLPALIVEFQQAVESLGLVY